MAIDASTSAILKTRAAETMEEDIYVGRPVLALITKKFGIGGKAYQSPLTIGAPTGRGKRFADAVANMKQTKRVEMDIVHQENYQFATAPGIDAALASGGQNSVVDLLAAERSAALSVAAAMLEQQITRGDSFGTLAKITSVISGTTATVVVQLDNKNDAFSIFVDDVLAAKSDPATASLQTGTWTVTNVDAMAGRLTMVAAGGADATSYAGYTLGLAATYANSTTPQCIQGLRTLFTRTGLTNAFEGLASRASDPVRLAGHFYSVGSMSVKDTISLLIASVGAFPSAKSRYALVSSASYLQLEGDLGERVRYSKTDGNGAGKGAGVDFDTISYESGMGSVTVIGVPTMHDEDVFLIDPTSLLLTSATEELISPLDEGEEGSGWIQLQTSDAKRLALRSLGGFSCNKFFVNGRGVRTV